MGKIPKEMLEVDKEISKITLSYVEESLKEQWEEAKRRIDNSKFGRKEIKMEDEENRKIDKEISKIDFHQDTLYCPFLHSACIQEKCVMWKKIIANSWERTRLPSGDLVVNTKMDCILTYKK